MRNLARNFWLLLGMIFLFILLYNAGLLLLGYPRSSNAIEVAEWIVQGHRDPSLCFKMNTGIGLGPPSSTVKNLCVFKVAESTKDPSVCELLMPSRYGLSCVGAATEDDPCFIRPNRSVGGNGIKVGLKECVQGSKAIRENACCIVAKVALLKNENDCSSLKGQTIFSDQCYNELAFKNHDASSCEKISNPTIKTGCIINAEALKQDPSICSGCTQAVESIEDL